MMVNLVETVSIQESIIKMQSDIINDLFGQLSQYVTADELDQMECVKKINDAAELKTLI